MTTPREPTVDDRLEGRLEATRQNWVIAYERANRAEADIAHLRDRLALAEAKLAESERVSTERLARLSELRDTLARIETASRKLGVAPGHLGDMAGRTLGGP